MSAWMASMYSCSSLSGFVSSNRRLQCPPNSWAIPKLRAIDLAWPMWRYPFGSGGKRVTTSFTRPARTSAATISRMKSLRSVAVASVLTVVDRSRSGGAPPMSPLAEQERRGHALGHHRDALVAIQVRRVGRYGTSLVALARELEHPR